MRPLRSEMRTMHPNAPLACETPRHHRLSFLLVPLLAFTLCSACASVPSAFSTKYPDNVEDDLAGLIQRLHAAPPRSEATIGVGVTAAPERIYGYDLAARRVLWQTPAKPQFAPLLAGDTVVTQEDKRIVGRDLKSGDKRFSLDAGDLTLNGADGDDANVVLVLTSGMGTYARSRVLLMQGGQTAWSRDLAAPGGVPALIGNVVLVPWANQYLSALTLAEGNEFARLRVRDGVIAQARVDHGNVFAGSQHGVAQLTNAIVSGSLTTGPFFPAPKEDLPGRPSFMRDAYAHHSLPTPESAQNRIRLSWLPEPAGDHALGMSSNHLYLVFYRFVFALDAKTLALHWVYAHDHDLVGARAQPKGLIVADTEGEVRFLAATSGKSLWFEKNGLPSVDVELPGEGAAIGSADDTSQPDATAVRLQLMAAAQDPDARLVPMRMLAIDLLAKMDDGEATANLLGLCEDERTTAPIRKAACSALKDRKSGTDYIIRALQRHASYLDDTSPPPVGALAKAAATQHEKRAVPELVAHLQDPSTPPQTLAPLVTALADLGDPSAVAPLADFLLLYHADPVDEHLTRALEAIPDALVKLQGAAAHETLERVVGDPLGAGTIRERARRALTQLDDQAKAAEKNEEAEKLAAVQAKAKAAEPAKIKTLMPTHITVEIVKQVLLPVRGKLQNCVQNAKPETFQARVVLVIEDGQLLMVSVLPESLQTCIEPLIRSQKFPMTQISKRERLSYTVKRY